ncbi:MAG: ArsA family ATPase [Deltaproteobacteria bacterium]|nr:ArsA family ATPase [Deltaproteobacteria bacterium]
MSAAAANPLDEILNTAKLLVLSGSGGVGKTTSSAALAVLAAQRGRRVLVLTIDPARRLLQALGLQGDSPDGKPAANVAHPVLPKLADQLPGGVAPGGCLDAMMLDASSGAIAMVERLLPTPELRDQVLNNRIYRAFLPTLQASPDYMALELIFELAQSGRYDLLVLDTPPMHNALDFLRAGNTLASFINERVLKWFSKVPLPGAKPKGGLLGWFGAGSSMAMGVLGKLFGSDALPDIAQFFVAFQDVLPRLKERALATDAMLRQPSTQFLVVTAPGETSLREARHLYDQLRSHGIAVAGFVVNRVLQVPEALHGGGNPAELRQRLGHLGLVGEQLERVVEQLTEAARRLEHLRTSDSGQFDALRKLAGKHGFCSAVPQREGDIHHLAQLRELAQAILDGVASGVVP